MNSLRDITGVSDWISGMLLLFRSPKYSRKIFFTLEGESDIRFLNTHFADERIHYDSPCSGKPEVINAVQLLRSHGKQNVYGLCDADFDILEGNSYENIHFTDCHDLEMMLIEGGSFDKFISEFLKKSILRIHTLEDIRNNLKESIIDVTYKIGILKWLNFKNNLLLMFKGMKYDNFITFVDFSANIDIDNYIQHILDRSPRKPPHCDFNFLKKEYQLLYNKQADYKYVCNGHDFTYITMMAFHSEFSRDKNITQEKVESHLRIAYSATAFQRTNIYNELSGLIDSHNI